MTATRAGLDDLDWILALLTERRTSLVDKASVFWNPATLALLGRQT